MVKILHEDITSNVEIVTENVINDEGKTEKACYIEGIFLQADIKNKNGRVYPMATVANAVQRYNEQYILTGRSLGELGHPDSGQINLHLASHKIEWLRQEGKNWIGRAKILDTPMGRIAKTLIKEGVKLGVSLRGYGTVTEKNGARFVGSDFFLATVDIVADPSAPDAFVNGIMESAESFHNQGLLLQEDFDYIQKNIKHSQEKHLTEGQLLGMFENLMEKLK